MSQLLLPSGEVMQNCSTFSNWWMLQAGQGGKNYNEAGSIHCAVRRYVTTAGGLACGRCNVQLLRSKCNACHGSPGATGATWMPNAV